MSVGEVLLLRPLVARAGAAAAGLGRGRSRRRRTTGLAVARRTFPDLVTFYAPLDFSWATRRAVARVRPTVLALVELELWPNLVWAAKRAGARVAIINGRLSLRSHRGYRQLRGPLGPTLRRLDAWPRRPRSMPRGSSTWASPSERVRVTGSVKYDGLESDRNNARTLRAAAGAGLSARPTWSSSPGSTMEGEEAAALAAYRAAGVQHPGLRLVLVPRHAERFEEVAAWLERKGRRSSGGAGAGTAPRPGGGAPPVILIDTIGELSAVWGLADVAFVGGSLLPGPRRAEHDGAGRLRRRRSCSARTPPTSARPSSSSWLAARPRAGRRRRRADLRP